LIAIHTDGKIANIPLMKIASFYRNVEWYLPLFHTTYEKIYYSKIFNFTKKLDYEYDMIIGGTGHDIKTTLPEEIESCQPDYSIYPDCNYTLQFYSRGCIRKCNFCVVPEKEGNIHAVEPMNINPKSEYIRILDNNFFANPSWNEAIKHIKKCDLPVMYDGIDIRIINDEQARALTEIKLYKQLHIAWDNPRENIEDKIKLLTQYIKPYKIACYVLIGFNSTPEQDIYRVEKLRALKIDPFVMPYDKTDIYQRNFTRWVNHKAIFKSVLWKDYANKNYKITHEATTLFSENP